MKRERIKKRKGIRFSLLLDNDMNKNIKFKEKVENNNRINILFKLSLTLVL